MFRCTNHTCNITMKTLNNFKFIISTNKYRFVPKHITNKLSGGG